MKQLADLLKSEEGTEFLRENEIYTHPAQFTTQLKKPTVLFGAKQDPIDKPVVYAGQQIYLDYTASVRDKIQLLAELDGPIDSFFLWLDTDRSGSDKLISKIIWPVDETQVSISISTGKNKNIETRFVKLDQKQIRSSIDRLGTLIRQTNPSQKAIESYSALRKLFSETNASTLAELNLEVTSFLVEDYLQVSINNIIASQLIQDPIVLDALKCLISQREGVIEAYNNSVQKLVELGIDPQVRKLPPFYLPLHFSCDQDNTRVNLTYNKKGEDHYAAGECKCGKTFEFFIGSNTNVNLDEVVSTNRWSPDVTLPLLLREGISGAIVGKSSALYGIVLNQVLKEALSKTPVPMLVPNSSGDTNPQSLIHNYINQ